MFVTLVTRNDEFRLAILVTNCIFNISSLLASDCIFASVFVLAIWKCIVYSVHHFDFGF